MTAPLPAAEVTGTLRCALCGQVSVDTEGKPMLLLDAVYLLRAHQRSQVCT